MFRDVARALVPRGARLWARHPVLSARSAWHAAAARAGRAARVSMTGDWDIVCHPAAVQPFEFERQLPELRAELAGFIAACTPGMVFFDIGAHYGLFTLAALRYGGPRARVAALDPSADALAVFDANMRLARAGDRVWRRCAAAGAHDGEIALLTSGAAGWHMMTAPGQPRPDAVTVPCVTLDRLAETSGLAPTHVKIDVEGEEESVLRGGEALLSRARPILFLELHGDILRASSRSPRAVLDRVVSLGYTRFHAEGREIPLDEAAAREVARIICRA
jgi:FkbM family methyltransferase